MKVLWHYIIRSKYGIQINGWDAKEGRGVLTEVHGNLFLKAFTYSFKISSWGWARGIKSDFGNTCGLGMFHFQLVFRASSIYPCYIILLWKKMIAWDSSSSISWRLGFRRNLNDLEASECASLLSILDNTQFRGE